MALSMALCVWIAQSQTSAVMTLEQAEAIALRNHPRIAAAALNAQAAGAVVTQVRAAFQPQLTGNFTVVGAEPGATIAAGTLQTSGVSSRASSGLGLTQLVTDFGRTANMAESARLRASAQRQNIDTARAQVLLQVRQYYYATLSSEAVLQVAQARVEMHRLTLRQVGAMSESGLKSTLDVSFAEVALSESELALYQAENAVKANRALLGAAMGNLMAAGSALAEVPLPVRIGGAVDEFVQEALRNRPELSSAKSAQSAAERSAEAERRLRYPSIAAVAAVGTTPVRYGNLSDHYSAAGLNITLPILNGGMYASRQAEAELRARNAAKEADALAVQVAGAARTAWLDADTAWRRIALTVKLVEQTTTALRLAQTRYEIGLSGILELTQSQLALISAQIGAVNARYDYLTRVANLNHAIGALR